MKKFVLFVLAIGVYSCLLAQEEDIYDTIVFYDAEIINQDFLSIIDSFLVFEKENVTYYSDTMSSIIYFGHNSKEHSKAVYFKIKPFPVEFFYSSREYAYVEYKNHTIYFTLDIHNPLNASLFRKSNKHVMIKKHFEDKEAIERQKFFEENDNLIIEEDGYMTEFENMLQMQTSWQYFYVNKTFKEYRKLCPCCYSYRNNCNKKKVIHSKTE